MGNNMLALFVDIKASQGTRTPVALVFESCTFQAAVK